MDLLIRHGHVLTMDDAGRTIPDGAIAIQGRGSRSKSVHTVIVDGLVVLDGGVFTRLDEPRLLAQIDEASRALLARMNVRVEPNRRPARG